MVLLIKGLIRYTLELKSFIKDCTLGRRLFMVWLGDEESFYPINRPPMAMAQHTILLSIILISSSCSLILESLTSEERCSFVELWTLPLVQNWKESYDSNRAVVSWGRQVQRNSAAPVRGLNQKQTAEGLNLLKESEISVPQPDCESCLFSSFLFVFQNFYYIFILYSQQFVLRVHSDLVVS